MAGVVQDLPDLLKLLLETTAAVVPDNPAEVLTAYDGDEEDVAMGDAATLPNAGHSGTYEYGESVAKYGLAQWS